MAKRLIMLLAGLFLVIGTALADDRFSGVVIASDAREPIIGATVKVVETTMCTVTYLDGKFFIDAPDGAKLEISYMGMASKTLKAAKLMSIKLEPNSKVLQEVGGYGLWKLYRIWLLTIDRSLADPREGLFCSKA